MLAANVEAGAAEEISVRGGASAIFSGQGAQWTCVGSADSAIRNRHLHPSRRPIRPGQIRCGARCSQMRGAAYSYHNELYRQGRTEYLYKEGTAGFPLGRTGILNDEQWHSYQTFF